MKNTFLTSYIKEQIIFEKIENYEKVLYADEVYSLLKESYKNVKGGLLFESVNDLVESTGRWDLIFFDSKVVGAIVYKAKKGLKMVALGISKSIDTKISSCVKSMLTIFCRQIFRFSWMEVSEGAEKFFMKNGASSYLIPNIYAKQLLVDKDIISLCDDGYHYKREIKNGIVKTKILIGNPKSDLKRHKVSN